MTAQQETITLEMTENEMKTLVRNALMVAGQEMGETGDHWPVIKNTITDIMRDWEELHNERAFQAEIKTHLYQQLKAMEEVLDTCEANVKEVVAPRLHELREIYDAHFTAPAHETIDFTDNEIAKPIHLQRAEAILQTLEEDDA